MQTEKSGTLGTGNDQTIFTPTPINLMVATRCKALGRGTGFGVGEPGDPANTISAAHSHGVFATAIPINDKATRWQGGGESHNHDGGGNDQTIFCLQGNGIDRADTAGCNGKGWKTDESDTLNTIDRPAVCAEVVCLNPWDAQSARVYDQDGAWHSLNVLAKANCAYREDAETYICRAVDCRNGQESDVGGALQARTGHTLNANGVVRSNMVVRRLTPMECERLQGFTDGWTDIGEWSDEKGKKHKDADSPRYKALGNSIALPFWDWMLRRMARYLPEGATLGSLFDGIGGFPLCFERIHGKGTARWASEIEPFPIAVTKRWFGEE